MYLNTVFKYDVFKYCPALENTVGKEKKIRMTRVAWKCSLRGAVTSGEGSQKNLIFE